MAKNVFRPVEIMNLVGEKIKIKAPIFEVEETVSDGLLDEYTGPTADDLRREAEAFKLQWEAERQAMIQKAQAEAEIIVKNAEQVAFDEVKKKTDQAQRNRQEIDSEAQRVLDNAKKEAEEMLQAAQKQVEDIKEEARKAGEEKGLAEGFESGKAEVERLIERIHIILDKAIEQRREIIEETEVQIIELVLLISRKVIKVISDNQKNVVVNNVVQALRKLKSRGDVAIRVNLSDLQLTTNNVKEFMRMVETVKSITVLEDSSVDKGGCIIETDFGQIDARISSQLREVEDKILELIPIKTKHLAQTLDV